MTCQIIDGTRIAAQIRNELKGRVYRLKKNGIHPSLVAVLVGNDPASQIYVQKKLEACKEVGIAACTVNLDSIENLEGALSALNENDEVHGYILQLPLPSGILPYMYFDMISPDKDVDVFNPINVGRLVQGRSLFKPCTPRAVQVMLNRSGITVAEKKVVIINRSNVVGKPLSSMLIQECDEYANATVTVCHDRTPPSLLKEVTSSADIVVVAVGKPGFLTADMVKPGAAIIDVGITRVGKKIVGDADIGVREVAGWVSPVPGGVGPLTCAMLLENVILAAEK